MGREVKRVPTNFDWPIGKTWSGYLISTCIDNCEDCRKAGDLMGYKRNNIDCPDFPAFDPPNGTAYQVWETTSEGSPISPPFEDPHELAEWLETSKASSFGDMTCSYDQWLEFITGPGEAPTAILVDSKLRSGVCTVQDNN